MESNSLQRQARPYINPYLGGVLLGLILLATFYITGRGLGASGSVKSVVVSAVSTVSPSHAAGSPYYQKVMGEGENPLENWLVYEVLGVIVGAFLSGVIAGRLRLTTEHGPSTTARTRLIFAAAGGILFGIGSQFGRGCTSGAALTGMASLSLAGYLAMLSIFGTGYIFAYFFRKLWL